MLIWKCSRSDRRVARARHRVQIRIRGLLEPGAFANHALEPRIECTAVLGEVITPKLVDDEHHEQLRASRRLLGSLLACRRRSEWQDEKERRQQQPRQFSGHHNCQRLKMGR